MKYFFITGESSGDFVASKVVKALYTIDPNSDVQYWGGSHLKMTKGKCVQDIKELSFMGFWQVVKQLPKIYALVQKCKNELRAFDPDVIVFVDFAGFNLKIAKWAKNRGYKTIYLIPPKTWASRSYRNKNLKKNIDSLISLFPFEQEYFNEQGIQCEYYGHPLLELNGQTDLVNPTKSINKKITIAPGSRRQEIKHILPIVCSVIPHFDQLTWYVSVAPDIDVDFIKKHIPKALHNKIIIETRPLKELFKKSDLAIVTSGTATLEAAIYRVPQVVCYRTNYVNFWLAKLLIKTPHISLVNIILKQAVVTELIQDNLSEENLIKEVLKLMDDNEIILIAEKYNDLIRCLKTNNTSEKIAQAIFNCAQELT